MSLVSSLTFNARALTQLVPALIRSGIVSTEGGPKAFLQTTPTLGRYWFTFAREVEHASATCPDRLALIDDDGVLTYRQFRDHSRILARHLLSLGEKELHIGVMARNGRGIMYPLAAKGYAGAHIYLLNVGSSAEQIEGIIKETGINVLIADDEFADRMPENLDGVHFLWAHTTEPRENSLRKVIDRAEDVEKQKLPLLPKHGAIVLMSSGTTGIPKGIVRPEPKLPFVVAGVLRAVPMKAGQRIHMTASMFHTWGWSMTNIAFAARATLITQRVFDPEDCLAAIEKYKADGLISSPIFLKQMLQVEGHENYDTSTLQYIASSGHALSPEIVRSVNERFGEILCNIYGSTELTLAASANAEEVALHPTAAGKISAGTQLKILDDDGNEVPRGETGQIFLYNTTSLTGYTNPKTPMVKVGNLIQIGDLGYIDEENRLHVLGRIDDMIIVGGENVHPESVLDVLEPMPGIKDLAAMGVEDPDTFQRIAVWIVREDSEAGAALTADSVRAWVADHLADHSIPRDVTFIDSLPRNATGKVMARFLK